MGRELRGSERPYLGRGLRGSEKPYLGRGLGGSERPYLDRELYNYSILDTSTVELRMMKKMMF
jgi:hypothetical protein